MKKVKKIFKKATSRDTKTYVNTLLESKSLQDCASWFGRNSKGFGVK